MKQSQCSRCGDTFDHDVPWSVPMYCPGCEDYEQMKKEEAMEAEEKCQRLRRQSKTIANFLVDLLNADTNAGLEEDFQRAGGDVPCGLCGLTFFDHPQIEAGPLQGLVVTCEGRLVKL